VDALGISGSMASGIIEYLAEGTWTKRMHPGWAAQSGLRAALLGRAGFKGPRTVFEGTHGLFHGFARTREGDFDGLLDGFGERWVTPSLAFKPYPCGTMIQPYIDCARRLRDRVPRSDDIAEIVADVGEGTVHRLWEPLEGKQRPPNGYAAKFSTPYCIAAALLRDQLGLDAFTDDAVADPDIRALAAKVRYRIDPGNPYPREFTGHLRATLRDGSVVEERQSHLRGGAREPLGRADIEDKFRTNARAGGFPGDRAEAALQALRALFDGPVNLEALRG
jgi:2-methylcitrate dehydratase PrpD